MASNNFPIDPSSFSYEEIKAELEAFLQSQPDADQWSLFFQSASGQSIIELVSSFSALMRFDTIVARREAYIQFAQNRSSKIGASQFLGYSTFRGRNAVLKMTITPIATGVYEKYDIIGTVKDRDLILLDSYAYNAGVPLEVEVVVGEILEETKQAQNTNLGVFKFTEPRVSEDVRIFIDNVELEYSDNVADMLNGKFQLQSNAFGSVDAKYLNLTTFLTRYLSGSEIKLQWVGLKDVEFVLSDVALDEADGTLDALEYVDLYKAPETDSSIEINAPLKNETKGHVRARNDQPKLFQQLDTAMIDASAKDVSAAVMEIFYLKEDRTRYSQAEKDALVAEFDIYRPHGLLPPIISDPDQFDMSLNFTIVRDPNGVGDPIAAVDEVLEAFEYKLGASFNLIDLEQSLESYPFIKIARIEVVAGLWEALKSYKIGDPISVTGVDNLLYKVQKITYRSGGLTEPIWPTISGQQIEDGTVVWEAFFKSDVTELLDWEQNTIYDIGSVVRPSVPNDYAYRVVDVLNRTGSTEPVWPPLAGSTAEDFVGTVVYDGSILWSAIQQEGTPDTWTASQDQKRGDVVIPTDQVASDNVGVAWQVQAYLGVSDAIQPIFPSNEGEVVLDGNIIWEAIDPLGPDFELDASQYYIFTKSVTVS